MVTQITIGENWTPLTGYGEDIRCWLDYDDDGASGSMEVRVIESKTVPTNDDFSKAERIYKPMKNDDEYKSKSTGSAWKWYAKCKAGSAIVSVKKSAITDFNKMVDQGKLFYLQNRTRASDATRFFNIKTGSKRLNIVINISSGLATQINFVEKPTTVTATTELSKRNYNRNFADDGLTCKVFAATAYTGGTNISPNQSGFGSNPGQAASGVSNEAIKYTLEPNTNYVYELDPDASTDTIGRVIGWEED